MAEKAIKQDLFAWEGTDRRGNRVKGESRAANQNMIKADLRRQGITPLKVRKKSALASRSKKKKITPKDIAIFTRQLATMMSAGVPLVQAFEIIGRGHENPAMQELVMAIKNDIEGGSNLRDALARHPLYFDELVCNLVEAGEAAGVLDTLLDKIATYKEKTEALKGKIRSAMVYPISVLVVAFIVSGILLIYVVPQFESIFAGFGAELPAFTQMVVHLSEWAQTYWLAVVGGIAAVFVAFREFHRRSKAFRDAMDRIMLRAPVAGDIIAKSAVARFARTLSTTFSAGVPLVDALNSVAGATGNIVYRTAVHKVREDVSSGQQLHFSMRSTGVFPNMVLQMTAIGEESGALDEMLDKAASYFEEQVDNAVDSLTSLMEPLIMSVLGVLVGGLLIAMYLPIFQMGNVVGGGH